MECELRKNKSVDSEVKQTNTAPVFVLVPVHHHKAKGWDLINLSVQVRVSEPRGYATACSLAFPDFYGLKSGGATNHYWPTHSEKWVGHGPSVPPPVPTPMPCAVSGIQNNFNPTRNSESARRSAPDSVHGGEIRDINCKTGQPNAQLGYC